MEKYISLEIIRCIHKFAYVKNPGITEFTIVYHLVFTSTKNSNKCPVIKATGKNRGNNPICKG